MNLLRLIMRSLAYYRASSAGVAAGAAIATAVLVGALLVGDSVRGTLRDIALARIGNIHRAVITGDRFFRAELANDGEAAVIMLPGSVTTPDGTSRANGVQVAGVDQTFWQLAPHAASIKLAEQEAAISATLARQLGVAVGDTIIARVEQPSALSRDMPLASDEDAVSALRLTVAAVLDDDAFGRFSLQANQAAPMNLFVSHAVIAEAIDMAGRANLLLSARDDATLANRWTLDDLQLELHKTSSGTEVRSPRVFIDQPIANLGSPLLTYFVNSIANSDRAAPYSTVTAIDSPLTQSLGGDEAVITQWLADDLGVNVGDELTLTYYTMGASNRLTTQTATVKVAKVIATDDPSIDAQMMPDFPGLSDAEHCRDWEAGFPIDYDAIRPKDEAYWENFRGTPKVLLPYRTGVKLWANRFGDLTAVRMAGTDAETKLRAAVDLDKAGLRYVDVRSAALAAVNQSLDFGQLFLGLSFFLLIAAGVLTGLLFVFGIEQRSQQVGMFAAVGWKTKTIRRVLMGEGLAMAIIGAVIGTALGAGYTKAILAALSSVWSDAVVDTQVSFHASARSLIGGAVGGVVIALIAMRWAMRKQMKRSARDLLTGATTDDTPTARRGGFVAAIVLVIIAGVLAYACREQTGVAAAGAFFGVGALLLLAVIATCHGILAQQLQKHSDHLTIANLGIRYTARRRGRSLATIILLACGCFMVIAVGANRQGASDVGTGGFALYAESTLPIYEADLGLDADIAVVPLRVRSGDDASCLNLNRAQQPTLLGVDSAVLAKRKAFGTDAWATLPASNTLIGDEATVMWGLTKEADGSINVRDGGGNAHAMQPTIAMPNSILQGTLVIDEQTFTNMYPSVSGYQRFLIDVPPEDAEAVAKQLTSQWGDYGLQVTRSDERLAMFSAVEHAYLSIFAALGALGLMLGTAGLGMVVLRNMLDRRGELALLTAVGWPRGKIHRLVWAEHSVLLALGVIGGSIAALAAVWPALRGAAHVPIGAIAIAVGAIVVSGMVWVWGATWGALRGELVEGLRRE